MRPSPRFFRDLRRLHKRAGVTLLELDAPAPTDLPTPERHRSRRRAGRPGLAGRTEWWASPGTADPPAVWADWPLPSG
jgi:hypothetical protein